MRIEFITGKDKSAVTPDRGRDSGRGEVAIEYPTSPPSRGPKVADRAGRATLS